MTISKVADVIEEAIVKSGKLKEGIIRGYWKNIVGKLAIKSQPLWIKDNTLYVLVEDSLYLHHMFMNKSDYLKKIEKILKKDYVKEIRFRVAKVNELDYSKLFKKDNADISDDFIVENFKSELEGLTIEKQIEILKKKSKEREKVLKSLGYKQCNICGTFFLGEETVCKPCSLKKNFV